MTIVIEVVKDVKKWYVELKRKLSTIKIVRKD